MRTFPNIDSYTNLAHLGKLTNLYIKPTFHIQIPQLLQIKHIEPLNFDPELNFNTIIHKNMKHEEIVFVIDDII